TRSGTSRASSVLRLKLVDRRWVRAGQCPMPSPALVVSDQDRATLESWTRSSTVSAGQRERAEIVLAVASGTGVSGTARTLGVSRPTVIKWRDRFAVDGVAGLADLPRSGRPKR